MPLNSFPQNQQGQANILEIGGDAPDYLRAIVAQLRFKKTVVRWLNNLVQEFGEKVNVNLFEPALLTTDNQTLYEQPNFRTNIEAVTLVNTTANAALVTIYITTGEADQAHIAWRGQIAAGSVATAAELIGQSVESDEVIIAVADIVGAVSVRMSGLKDRLQ